MRKSAFTRALCGALFAAIAVLPTQAQLRHVRTAPDDGEVQTRHEILPAKYRYTVQVGSGVMTNVFGGGHQNIPVVQAAALYSLSGRVALGLAYGYASATARPYIDELGVASHETSNQQYIGARLVGDIASAKGFALYGGLQIGVTGTKQTYRHEFPAGLIYESEAAYLASRPSPFYRQGSQLGASGFLGLNMRLLPHVHSYVEVGNSLAVISAGVQARF